MAAVFQAIGNQSAGAASVAVAWPAHQTGDLGLMVIETGGEGTTLTVPSGWTAVTGSPVTDVASTAGSKLQVWYKFAASNAEANVNTGDSGDHQVARIVTFRGVDPTTPFDVTPVTATKTTASTTVTWNSITTATDGALIVLIATRPNDATSVTTFGAAVNANLSGIGEAGEGGTNAGHGGGFVVAYGTKATAGATGTTTSTSSVSVTNAEMIIALRPEPAAQDLTPSLYTNDQTFHNPTVTPGAVALAPDLYTNGQTFYSPDVTQPANTQDLTPDLYTNGQTFYSPTVAATYDLAPARYDNAQTFYPPTLTATATLAPALYTNDQTFYQPAVTASYTLAPDLFTNAQTFYQPTVTTSVTLQASLYTNDQTFYGPLVSQTGGAQTLLPDLYTNAQTFYQPTVTPGAVTLQPSLYTNDQTFYQPTISTAYELTPARYDNDQTFFPPTVSLVGGTQVVAPDLVTNTSTFFAPTVSATYTLAPQDYVDPNYVDPNYIAPNTSSTQVFYSPSIGVLVKPALFTNSSTFFSPTVELQSYLITKAQALELYKVWLLHGLGAPLAVGATSRTAGAVEQSVSQSGSTVTVATTAAPTVVVGDPGTMIQELSALHGLTTNLVTTASSRTAGAIVQTFSTSGPTTTVTRQ